MFGKTSEALVKTTAPIVVGRFDTLMAPRYVRMPAKRAANVIAVGHAVPADEADVPKGETIVVYSEQDFEAPHAKPVAKPPILEVADVLRRFNWSSPADILIAQSCGFPEADQTILRSEAGVFALTRVPRWSEHLVEAWREKLVALKVR
jgi:hypothetical protein